MLHSPRHLRFRTTLTVPKEQIHEVTINQSTAMQRDFVPVSSAKFRMAFPDGRLAVLKKYKGDKFLWLYLCKPGREWPEWAIARVIDKKFEDVDSAREYVGLPEAWEF